MHNQRFHEQYDNKKLTIDEMKILFSESGYQCIGHGTGRNGNGIETVKLILENGLRTKDNSLYFTGIPLSTPTPEIIQNHKELGIDIPTIDSLKKTLNNWEHMDSKKVIIARLPVDYINWKGDRDDHDSEMYGAFMNDVVQQNGDIKYYLDSRFILGYYDADIKKFIINSKYERALTDELKKKLKLKYLKTLKKTRDRLKRSSLPYIRPLVQEQHIQNDFDYSDYNADDWIEWDIPENNKNK